jgi:hypothetical protein
MSCIDAVVRDSGYNRVRRKMVRSAVAFKASSPCLKDFAYGGIAMTLFRFHEDFAVKVQTCTAGA